MCLRYERARVGARADARGAWGFVQSIKYNVQSTKYKVQADARGAWGFVDVDEERPQLLAPRIQPRGAEHAARVRVSRRARVPHLATKV